MTGGLPVERSSRPGGEEPRNWIFWAALAMGWAVIAFGLRGLLHEHSATNPVRSGLLLLKLALIHDLLLAPLVFGLGFAVVRFVPERARALVQSGLMVSGVVALFSYPFVRGFGRAATNPSALPVNYGRGLFVIVVMVWAVVAALLWWRLRRSPVEVR